VNSIKGIVANSTVMSIVRIFNEESVMTTTSA